MSPVIMFAMHNNIPYNYKCKVNKALTFMNKGVLNYERNQL